MRFGHTSTLSFVSVGVALALAHGCGGVKESTFNGSGSGSGSQASGSSTGTTGSGPVTSSGSVGSGPTSSSTTIQPPPTTGSSGAGGSGNFGDANCGAVTQGTKQLPTDIFIMQDKSGSMTCPAIEDMCTNGMNPNMVQNRWEATTTALNSFFMSPASAQIGVGIGFFSAPGGAACNVASYSTPAVAIAPLATNAMALAGAVAMNMPNGNTPTTPAITGAIEYARAYTAAQMGMRTASVVFVSDGIPSGCNSSVQNAAAAAAAGFMGTPPIKTYVVGMGNVAALDEIAHAGAGVPMGTACRWEPAGTTECYFNANGDISARLQAALTSITGMITCNFPIPASADPLLVNLEVNLGGAMPKAVGKVDNMAACGAAGGWFYDVNPGGNPPMRPTQIILCPQTCTPLQMTPDSGVQLKLGCPSQPPA